MRLALGESVTYYGKPFRVIGRSIIEHANRYDIASLDEKGRVSKDSNYEFNVLGKNLASDKNT